MQREPSENMCCFSLCGQIIYGLLMLACIALTATSLFTSSWSEAKDVTKFDGNKYQGIMPWTCVNHSQGNDCKQWWKNIPGWQHAVVILMCISLIVELLALAWNVVTFFACCCKKYIIHPLTLFALVITICLTAALVVYGVNNKDVFKGDFGSNINTSLGWSFYVALGAAVVALADVVVGAMTVCLGESGM